MTEFQYLDRNLIYILPELEQFIRKQGTEEAELFRESIVQDGVRDPLLLVNIGNHKNLLIDGHHRYRVTGHYHQLPVRYLEHLHTLEDVKLWMLKNQLGRRNLIDAERIDIALKITEFMQDKAKQNQSKGGKDKGLSKLTEAEKVNTREEVVKLSGASSGNIAKFKKIKKEAPSFILSQVLSGETSIHKAYQQVSNNKSLTEMLRISYQKKLNESELKELITKFCQLSVPFIEASHFILSSFIKESISNYRIPKTSMEDVEEALDIMNTPGALKDEFNILRLEYFYKQTIKMIEYRMSYPDYHEVVDAFKEQAYPAWDKFIELKTLESKLRDAKQEEKKK
ncbi:ParB/Srx family N-terminal domain-containing protein [Flammeovirga aprica]|uniref:ParB/Sulfiredoxin domain-containing protein n=1 Tax=Flammeovirga aprica JL-4 TaxID=694437 RepID=A0A7X9RXL2_9BACT|nr:ParB/Srx family N-terminal domain-containing protein [Flammeovirga aprica]NME70553.1 hypothetical protein [Flammeovirga aprica JL-4]